MAFNLKQYKQQGMKLTHIPEGSKGPVHKKWVKTPTSYKKLKEWIDAGGNIGIIHSLSNTICFDIDDVDLVKRKHKLLAEFITAKPGSSKWGARYTSGKKNRLKILFRLPKKLVAAGLSTITIPGSAGQLRCGDLQDVLPPSTHPSGSKYEWLGEFIDIPILPKKMTNHLLALVKQQNKARKRGGKEGGYGSGSGSGYVFVDVYNSWAMAQEGYSLVDEIEKLDQYKLVGLTSLLRVGSSSPLSIMVYQDPDGIDRAYNFSNTEGKGLLKEGLHDPYSVLSFSMGFDEAREWVCTHPDMKGLIDIAEDTKVIGKRGVMGDGSDDSAIPRLRKEGVHFDEVKKQQPYLDMDTMMPRDASGKLNGFGRLVRSITFHQEGVYNPSLAFWYSLCLADYMIGGGYMPYSGNNTEPIYCFTSGQSGKGKTKTITSGNRILSNLKKNFTAESAKAGESLLRRCIITDVGSSQGIQDQININMADGCDILYIQDEAGLSGKGTKDDSGRSFRKLMLDYKSLGRDQVVNPRLLAQKTGKDAESGAKRLPKTCVHFTHFNTATDESLKTSMDSTADIGQGYIQRFIGGTAQTPYFMSRRRKYGLMAPAKFKRDKKLFKVLNSIVEVASASGTYRDKGKGVCLVGIEQVALDYLGDLSEIIIEDPSKGDNLGSKMVENIGPVAKVAAVFENPEAPMVTLDMVKWAHSVCSASVWYFKWLMGEIKDNGQVDKQMLVETQLLKYLNKHCIGEENARSRAVINSGANLSRMKIGAVVSNPVWNALIESEMVGEKVEETMSGHRKLTYYIAEEE